MKHIFFFLLFLLSLYCKQKDWREEIQPIDYKVLHADLLKKKDLPIQIQGGFSSKETLLKEFFDAVKKNPKGNFDSYILTKSELFDHFFPFTLGFGTSLDTTPLDSYTTMIETRKQMGFEKLISAIQGSDGKITKISWRQEARSFGPWVGYKPDAIYIKIRGSEVAIEEIKQVVSYQGIWKIAVIAP